MTPADDQERKRPVVTFYSWDECLEFPFGWVTGRASGRQKTRTTYPKGSFQEQAHKEIEGTR